MVHFTSITHSDVGHPVSAVICPILLSTGQTSWPGLNFTCLWVSFPLAKLPSMLDNTFVCLPDLLQKAFQVEGGPSCAPGTWLTFDCHLLPVAFHSKDWPSPAHIRQNVVDGRRALESQHFQQVLKYHSLPLDIHESGYPQVQRYQSVNNGNV